MDRARPAAGSVRRESGFMSRVRVSRLGGPDAIRATRPGAAGRVLEESGVLVGLLLVAVLFGLLVGPQFLRPANLELMARQTAIVCMAALGMTMVIVAGGIDLSVGSVIALATVVTALLLRSSAGPLVAALGAVGAGAICGALNGVLIT